MNAAPKPRYATIDNKALFPPTLENVAIRNHILGYNKSPIKCMSAWALPRDTKA